MNAGETLKVWRARRDNMSQMKLAVAVGVTLPAVSQWERGVHVPRRDVAQRIDEVLDGGGEILAAFGYVSLPVDARTEEPGLAARVDQLEEDLRRALDGAAGRAAQVSGFAENQAVWAARLVEVEKAVALLQTQAPHRSEVIQPPLPHASDG